MEHRPITRREGIVTEHAAGELLLIDTRSHQAHALCGCAARVWTLCDGTRSIDAIRMTLGLNPDQLARILLELDELDLLASALLGEGSDRRGMDRVTVSATGSGREG